MCRRIRTTSARREDCWKDGHGRGKLFSWADLLCRRAWLDRREVLVDEGTVAQVDVGFREEGRRRNTWMSSDFEKHGNSCSKSKYSLAMNVGGHRIFFVITISLFPKTPRSDSKNENETLHVIHRDPDETEYEIVNKSILWKEFSTKISCNRPTNSKTSKSLFSPWPYSDLLSFRQIVSQVSPLLKFSKFCDSSSSIFRTMDLEYFTALSLVVSTMLWIFIEIWSQITPQGVLERISSKLSEEIFKRSDLWRRGF